MQSERRPRRRIALARYTLPLLVLLLLCALSLIPAGILLSLEASEAMEIVPVSPAVYRVCPGQVPLTPVETPGWPWQNHRMWLVAELDYDGAPYVVINARTNLIYPWDHSHDEGGRAWFSVRTRWTLRNPSWKADPWVLRYRCGHIFAVP